MAAASERPNEIAEVCAALRAVEGTQLTDARTIHDPWLGVSCYLTPNAVGRPLDSLLGICPPDSRVLRDSFEPLVIDRTSLAPAGRRGAWFAERHGEPFQHCVRHDSITEFVGDSGFAVAGYSRIFEFATRYVNRTTFWLTVHDIMGAVMRRSGK